MESSRNFEENTSGENTFDEVNASYEDNLFNDNSRTEAVDIEDSNNLIHVIQTKDNKYTVDELLTISGEFGRMQWFSFFAILISNLGLSMYYYHFPYLELFPQFKYQEGNKIYECAQQNVCENKSSKRCEVDWEDDMSIHNWITEAQGY